MLRGILPDFPGLLVWIDFWLLQIVDSPPLYMEIEHLVRARLRLGQPSWTLVPPELSFREWAL
jgi:hypothetical protein